MCETLQVVSPGEKRETALIICDIIGYKLVWLKHKPSSLLDLEIRKLITFLLLIFYMCVVCGTLTRRPEDNLQQSFLSYHASDRNRTLVSGLAASSSTSPQFLYL